MTRWERFTHAIGFHEWVEEVETIMLGRHRHLMDRRRFCKCGRRQILVPVPAAPGGFVDWVDEEFFGEEADI